MSSKTITYALLACLLASVVSIFLSFRHSYKIAYVRSMELVYGFNGMKQAHTEYQSQTSYWQSNLDTLRSRYQSSMAYYQQHIKSFTPAEKEEQVAMLKRMENDMNQYAEAVNKEAQDKEAKLTQSVLNQINSFVNDYAKNKGYDIVLGADGGGTVLYGCDAMDITKEVLTALNKDYKPLPQTTVQK